ncbi:MAG: dihydroorotase [Lachnospiraceae bacterium]|nr:dihydroorotase [Lachnospiraceae bacterium]
MIKAIIKNGTIIDPKNGVKEKCDILIEGQVIKKIEKNIKEEGNYVIDAKGMIVSPGFVDVHTNFCDPGVTSREDLKTGSLAAAKGGFTWVVLGSENRPSTSEANVLDYIKNFRMIMPINIYPTAAVTLDRQGAEMSDMQFLKNHGAIGFSDGLKPIENKELLRMIMKKSKELDIPLTLYSEDLTNVKVRGVSAGKVATSLSIKGASPIENEENDLKVNLDIAKETGCVLNLAYISTKGSIDLLKEAKKENDKLYVEVNPYNIFYTEKLYSSKKLVKKEGLAKLLPPLRTEQDKKAIIDGIKEGVVDIISSNHMPLTKEEKEGKLKDVLPGAIGLEIVLGLIGEKLVKEKILKWNEVIEKICVTPALLYGLDKYGAGSIDVGNTANLTIFNPDEKWILSEEDIASKSKNCPLVGESMQGRVKYTICNGRLVYKDVKNAEKMKNDTDNE